MHDHKYIERFVNLLAPEGNVLFNSTTEEAVKILGTGNADALRKIDGQFALVHRNGTCLLYTSPSPRDRG